MERDRDEILKSAKSVEASVWQHHIRSFVASFVKKSRRDRWMFLLLKPTDKTRRSSHKLHSDLDRARCAELQHPWKLNPALLGVYDDDPRRRSSRHRHGVLIVGSVPGSLSGSARTRHLFAEVAL